MFVRMYIRAGGWGSVLGGEGEDCLALYAESRRVMGEEKHGTNGEQARERKFPSR